MFSNITIDMFKNYETESQISTMMQFKIIIDNFIHVYYIWEGVPDVQCFTQDSSNNKMCNGICKL